MKILYDDQASTYDHRTGLRAGMAKKIAQKLVQMASLNFSDTIIEIGPGTGQIGIELARMWMCYFGMDRSFAMLQQFHLRMINEHMGTPLIQADGTGTWPFVGNVTRLFFGSRSLHHIEPEHLLDEVMRLKHPQGALLIQGAIRRKNNDPRDKLSSEMQKHLAAEGFIGHKRQKWKVQIQEAAQRRGLQPLPETIAAVWSLNVMPNQTFENWNSKNGLAGLDVSDEVKHRVLEKTKEWALSNFGSLSAIVESREEYELFGFKLPPSR